MTFQASRNERAVRKAFLLVKNALIKGALQYERTLGYQGGNLKGNVFWHESNRFWVYFDWNREHRSEFLCLYGTQDPAEHRTLNIIVETDAYRSGSSRRTGGVFLRDGEGNICLGHTGQVRGGRRGIGKNAFTRLYRGRNWVSASWPDGIETEVLLIGYPSHDRFRAQVATFVHEVARLKEIAIGDRTNDHEEIGKDSFRVEFEGARNPYVVEGQISGLCDHGIVVNQLARQLESYGYRVGNDRCRDLFTWATDGSMDILFEVKSSSCLTDLYTGVGQLMLLGTDHNKRARRVLVIPAKPNDGLRLALGRLGIEVLVFNWNGDLPEFPNLSQLLNRRRRRLRG